MHHRKQVSVPGVRVETFNTICKIMLLMCNHPLLPWSPRTLFIKMNNQRHLPSRKCTLQLGESHLSHYFSPLLWMLHLQY